METYIVIEIALVLVFLAMIAFGLIRMYITNQSLSISENWLNSILHNVSEAVIFYNEYGGIVYSNELATNIISANQKFCPENGGALLLKSFYSQEEVALTELLTNKVWLSVKAYLHAEVSDSNKHILVGSIVPLFASKRKRAGTIVVLRDVTKEMVSEELIYNMSNYDALTGVPNKNYLLDFLSISLQNSKLENKMVGLMILGLDKFKTVNDIMGHNTGDILLKKVADTIKDHVAHGTQMARLGGDEFAIVLPSIRRVDEIIGLARKMSNIFKMPWDLDGKEYFVTASIGIAVYPNDGNDVETLMRNADTALNNAKDAGGNNYKFYTRNMNSTIIERFYVENSLRHAIDRDEFQVYYQPLYDAKTLKIKSCEALVRWVHPTSGVISPMKFIPIAEDTGLILGIGEMVLKKACEHHKMWIEAGLPKLKVAVNISARQFRHNNLLNMIETTLKQTQMDPRHLEVEITESFAMNNIDYVIYLLNEIRKLGISVAVDDFGTGYSSINYLKSLPVDSIKLDKSFIAEVETNKAQEEIVRAMISLSHGIGLKVTAEGVETAEQLTFLQEHGCDKLQGYYFSKPIPNDEFMALVLKHENNSAEVLEKVGSIV